MSKDGAEETIRERWEKLEYEILAPFASRAAESRGRARPEEKCGIRTDYQRDRDRILHCKAFRRLKHKTQVFIAPEVDHYRTRLTHTLEVAQIARTIARGLRLNEDLTEAIALGHDLGHTPFGHAGEAALNEVLSERVSGMRFNHFEQSVRVVDLLENDGRGLNLTYETWDGIRYHSKGGADILEDKDAPETWEGWAVRLSDRIAYISHDVDDAIRAGLVSVGDLPGKVLGTLGRTHSARINSMVRDVVSASAGRDRISMTPEVRVAADSLKDFLYEKVYSAEAVKNPKGLDVKGIVRLLVERFLANPESMPPFYRQMHATAVDERGRAQAVADFVAGMTDRYAARLADVDLPSE